MPKGTSRAITLLVLHVLLGIYALSDVFSKSASGQEFGSLLFFVLYGLVLVLLGVYALGWQQVIKRMPLSSAYANRAITIVWGIFWGALLFGESVTPGKIVGAAIIMAGIVVYSFADKSDAQILAAENDVAQADAAESTAQPKAAKDGGNR